MLLRHRYRHSPAVMTAFVLCITAPVHADDGPPADQPDVLSLNLIDRATLDAGATRLGLPGLIEISVDVGSSSNGPYLINWQVKFDESKLARQRHWGSGNERLRKGVQFCRVLSRDLVHRRAKIIVGALGMFRLRGAEKRGVRGRVRARIRIA